MMRPALGVVGGGAALCALVGCAEPRDEVLSFRGTSLVWPAPPDRARIRYIGELRGEASLGRKPTAGEALRGAFAGPQPRPAFSTPTAVAVSGMRVFVADPSHPGGATVHVLDLAAKEYSQIREAAGAALRWPIDVATSEGRVAIADGKRAAVFVLGENGQSLATIGAGTLQRPAGAAFSADGRAIWVLDAAAHALRRFDLSSGAEEQVIGRRGAGDGEFNFPAGVGSAASVRWLPPIEAAGEIVVADAMNFRVQLFDRSGAARAIWGKKGDAAGDFALPRDAASDSEGHIYVLDSQFENVQIFEPSGQLLLAFGGEGVGPGQFSVPSGITIDADDRIWIADTYNRRVQVFQYLRESGT